MQQAAIQQRLQHHRDAADLVHVEGDVFAAGLEVGDVGGAAHDLHDVVHGEADARLMRHRRQMQAGIGRAAGGADDDGGVFEAFGG